MPKNPTKTTKKRAKYSKKPRAKTKEARKGPISHHHGFDCGFR
jgi:hypothetical protein